VVKVIDISPHRRFSCIRQMTPMRTPYTESHKIVAMAMSVSFNVLSMHFVGRPLKPTSSLVAIVHTKPVIAILVPKLVAVTTTLRHPISAMSSLDSLTPKTHI